jgi:hypothetical protein
MHPTRSHLLCFDCGRWANDVVRCRDCGRKFYSCWCLFRVRRFLRTRRRGVCEGCYRDQQRKVAA